MRNIRLLLLLCLCPILLGAQPDEKLDKKEEALQHADHLKSGVLVVQLKTFRNQINALQNMSKTKRNQKYLNALLKERRELQRATITAYREFYTFSEVYFMPDTMARALLNGTREGIFINDSLEIDNDIDLSSKVFYIAYVGTPPTATSSGKISLLVTDKEKKLLPHPFPYANKIYGFFATLAGISEAEAIPKAVQRLEKRLWQLSEK